MSFDSLFADDIALGAAPHPHRQWSAGLERRSQLSNGSCHLCFREVHQCAHRPAGLERVRPVWYADTASTPNLSDEAIAGWQAAVDAGGTASLVSQNGAVLLNGSDPANEWIDDPGATGPGILPFAEQPQLMRDDYVFNANDSHWLANPEELLTGYSPLTGAEAIAQSARTRMNAVLLADPDVRGADGKWSLQDVKAAFTSNRALHSELLQKDVVAACERTSTVTVAEAAVDLAPACDVLRQWDGTYGLDSSGAVLWREFIYLFGNANRENAGELYSVPFDAADPVGTPNTLKTGSAADDQVILEKLGMAVAGLQAAGFAIDSSMGELQYDGRLGPKRIGLPGGDGSDGTISVVSCCSGSLTLALRGDPGTFSDVHDFSDKGYPVTNGNSFVMTMQFEAKGPVAETVLTYGQPDDPADPNFQSQTKLYSAGRFKPALFTAADVAAGAVSTIEVTGDRP